MKARKRGRIAIELSLDWGAVLDDLIKQTKATSQTEVVRNALDVYRVLSKKQSEGWEVTMKKNGAESPLFIP